MENNKPTISVIVPVYNVEKYIERCVRSLFQQTLNDIEYIFVDDCGKDQSISLLKRVLEEYPDKEECVQIISHERNLGSAAARHTGLQRAKGEYVIYCDSDDWVAENMYELLYNEAKKGNYDIVYCNYAEVNDEKYFIPAKIICQTNNEYIQNFLSGKIVAYLWNKLVKRKLYLEIDIPDGFDMWEDLYMCVQLFSYAGKIEFLDSIPLYFHSTDNMKSITNQTNKERIGMMIENINLISSFLEEKNIFESFINQRKMYCKLKMISSNYRIKEWDTVLPEVNNKMCISKDIPLHLKIIIWGLNRHNYLLYKIFWQIKCFSNK